MPCTIISKRITFLCTILYGEDDDARYYSNNDMIIA